MDLYNFKPQDAYDFARFVGIKTKPIGDELKFTDCPYCKGATLHKDPQTFAINLKTGAFNCKRASCGVTGNMITLARDFDFPLEKTAQEYYFPKKQYKRLKTPAEPIIPKPEAIEYLSKRGIATDTINKYQITVQTEHPNILVFPFFDGDGKLTCVKYRKTDFNKEKDKSKEWFETNTKPILFGMMQCKDFGRLVICEGQIDSLSVASAGIENAVSVPNGCNSFTWLPYCWDWINQFKEVVVFGDHERGHITLLADLQNRLNILVKHVRESDYGDCKDANEILQKYGPQQVRKCVENAVAAPIKKIIQLSDVEDVDISKLEKLRTGIEELDRLLYGGIPFGGITIVSGKPGEGKSTVSSQILARAIKQGYICFAYSGELPNYLFKAWLDFQIAGPKHVFEYKDDQFGDVRYSISKSNREMISAWYKDRCYLYDNSAIDGDETESLVETAEKAIIRYGARVILLDNLMTAIDLEMTSGNDRYERQSNFMKKLARLALKYNVIILLVAHKRKNNVSANENDEVMGSSDITNLALITIAYEKADYVKDYNGDKVYLNDGQRLLKVSKNRLFGKTETNGWIMDFDEKSKRVYGREGDRALNYSYGWCDEDEFTQLSDGDEPMFE